MGRYMFHKKDDHRSKLSGRDKKDVAALDEMKLVNSFIYEGTKKVDKKDVPVPILVLTPRYPHRCWYSKHATIWEGPTEKDESIFVIANDSSEKVENAQVQVAYFDKKTKEWGGPVFMKVDVFCNFMGWNPGDGALEGEQRMKAPQEMPSHMKERFKVEGDRIKAEKIQKQKLMEK